MTFLCDFFLKNRFYS